MSFKKKFLYTIIGLIILLVLILFIILLPLIITSIENNTNLIITLLNKDLEKNLSNTVQIIQSLSDETLSESTQTNRTNLENQATHIISFSHKNLLNTSNNFIEHEKQIIIEREKKRIADLTNILSENVRTYISDMDFVSLNHNLNKIMEDEEIRYIIVHQNLDRTFYSAYNIKNFDDLMSDTDYKSFIQSSLEKNETLLREFYHNEEAIIESVISIMSSTRLTGILNIGFSVESIYEKIIENSNIIVEDVEESFSIFQKSSIAEMENSVQNSNAQLSENLTFQRNELEKQLENIKQLLISNVERHSVQTSKDLTGKILFFITSLGIAFVIIGVFVAVKMAKIFSKPVEKFVEHTKIVSKGELNTKLNLATGDEFEILSNSFNNMCSEIKNSQDKLDEWNRSLEQTVKDKTNSIRTLLNNAGQGFLSFGESLTVNPEYSIECLNIFGKNIENTNFVDLIYNSNSEEHIFAEKVLKKLFEVEEDNKVEMYITLLPSEMKINNKIIDFEYKLILSDSTKNENQGIKNIMVILTDVTTERLLEEKMVNEELKLKMLVKVIVNYSEFIETINEFKEYYKKKIYKDLETGNEIEHLISEIFRKTHTFKGVLAQFGLISSVKNLQGYESELSIISKNPEKHNVNKLKDVHQKYENDLLIGLEEDISVLKDTFGEDFIKNNKVITIDKLKIIEIENKIVANLSPADCQTILPYIRKLRYKPITNYINMYADYLQQLSEQLNKSINPLIIESENLDIDPDIYENFCKSLVHIFRNSLYHGIETLEERISQDKNEKGTIKCLIKKSDSSFILTVSDDGRGIEIEKLKDKLIKNNLYRENMTDDDIIMSIFIDGVSTEDNINEISGRGIGLSAVKEEVDKLNGKIEISTQYQKGTTFTFTIPLYDIQEMPIIKSDNIIIPLLNQTLSYFESELKIKNSTSKTVVFPDNRIKFQTMAAVINLKGFLKGNIIMSLDKELALRLTHKMSLGLYEPEEEEIFIEASVLETLNIIVGKSMDKLVNLNNLLSFEPPYSIFSENIILTYIDSDISIREIKTDIGTIIIAVVVNIVN